MPKGNLKPKTGKKPTQRAQKQKREFKPKTGIYAKREFSQKSKREIVAPNGLRSKKGNLTRASIKSLRQRIKN